MEKSITKTNGYSGPEIFDFEFLFNFHTIIQQETVLLKKNHSISLGKTIPQFHAFFLPFPFDFLKSCKLKKNVLESKLQKIVQCCPMQCNPHL